MLKSFPKIWALGHINVADIFSHYVEITEKIDGSQFAFGWDMEGNYHCRSKGTMIDPDGDVPDLFRPVVEWSRHLHAEPNVCYYGETLKGPKHNTLHYGRTPHRNFVLFGASNSGGDTHAHDHSLLSHVAERLECDVVPLLYKGKADFDKVQELLGQESFLGLCKAEGVVVKADVQYELYGQHVPLMCGKFVTEEFKEVHLKNPEYVSGKSKLAAMVTEYKTEARWVKAVQHLRDEGKLLGEPKDIGNLMQELNRDFEEECIDDVKERLWKAYKKDFLKVIGNGMPQWYKEELAKGNVNTND